MAGRRKMLSQGARLLIGFASLSLAAFSRWGGGAEHAGGDSERGHRQGTPPGLRLLKDTTCPEDKVSSNDCRDLQVELESAVNASGRTLAGMSGDDCSLPLATFIRKGFEGDSSQSDCSDALQALVSHGASPTRGTKFWGLTATYYAKWLHPEVVPLLDHEVRQQIKGKPFQQSAASFLGIAGRALIFVGVPALISLHFAGTLGDSTRKMCVYVCVTLLADAVLVYTDVVQLWILKSGHLHELWSAWMVATEIIWPVRSVAIFCCAVPMIVTILVQSVHVGMRVDPSRPQIFWAACLYGALCAIGLILGTGHCERFLRMMYGVEPWDVDDVLKVLVSAGGSAAGVCGLVLWLPSKRFSCSAWDGQPYSQVVRDAQLVENSEVPSPASPYCDSRTELLKTSSEFQNPARSSFRLSVVFALQTMLMIYYGYTFFNGVHFMFPQQWLLWYSGIVVQLYILSKRYENEIGRVEIEDILTWQVARNEQALSAMCAKTAINLERRYTSMLRFMTFTHFHMTDTLRWIALIGSEPSNLRLMNMQMRWSLWVMANSLYAAVIYWTLPYFLAVSETPMDFVLNAFAIIYILDLDDEEGELTDSDLSLVNVKVLVPTCQNLSASMGRPYECSQLLALLTIPWLLFGLASPFVIPFSNVIGTFGVLILTSISCVSNLLLFIADIRAHPRDLNMVALTLYLASGAMFLGGVGLLSHWRTSLPESLSPLMLLLLFNVNSLTFVHLVSFNSEAELGEEELRRRHCEESSAEEPLGAGFAEEKFWQRIKHDLGGDYEERTEEGKTIWIKKGCGHETVLRLEGQTWFLGDRKNPELQVQSDSSAPNADAAPWALKTEAAWSLSSHSSTANTHSVYIAIEPRLVRRRAPEMPSA